MTLKELRKRANQVPTSDTNWGEAAQFMAEVRDRFGPNKIRYAIEDEAEREELEDLIIKTAVAKYYQAPPKHNL
jgi:hypothetical protein